MVIMDVKKTRSTWDRVGERMGEEWFPQICFSITD